MYRLGTTDTDGCRKQTHLNGQHFVLRHPNLVHVRELRIETVRLMPFLLDQVFGDVPVHVHVVQQRVQLQVGRMLLLVGGGQLLLGIGVKLQHNHPAGAGQDAGRIRLDQATAQLNEHGGDTQEDGRRDLGNLRRLTDAHRN